MESGSVWAGITLHLGASHFRRSTRPVTMTQSEGFTPICLRRHLAPRTRRRLPSQGGPAFAGAFHASCPPDSPTSVADVAPANVGPGVGDSPWSCSHPIPVLVRPLAKAVIRGKKWGLRAGNGSEWSSRNKRNDLRTVKTEKKAHISNWPLMLHQNHIFSTSCLVCQWTFSPSVNKTHICTENYIYKEMCALHSML